jgi:hypothetical protein
MSAAFLGKEHVYTAGEAIAWAAALGPACAARAALVTRPLTPAGSVRSAICRIVESSKIIFKFDDVTATKFLMHPMFSGCTNLPRLDKGEGKKSAAGVPAASVATAVGLGGEKGGTPPAKRPNSSLLEEAVYATRSRATPERTRTTWSCTMRTWPGAQPNVFLRKNTAAPCARGEYL